MDRFEDTALLEWWANRSTCLATLDVTVVISAGDSGGWEASGTLTDPQDCEYLRFFRELDPVFTLRFADNSAIPVIIEQDTESPSFTLKEPTTAER